MHVRVKYRDLESEWEGDYQIVWRGLNEFLSRIQSLGVGHEDTDAVYTPEAGGVQEAVLQLRSGGFFDTPREIGEIRAKLEQQGIPVSIPNLGMHLLTLTRNKQLERAGSRGNYVYAAPWVRMQGQEQV